MKNFLFAYLVLASAANAQEIVCPKFYPWQDTILAEVPYKHNGKGIVAREELSNASAMWGDFNSPAEFHGGSEKKVKGGADIEFPPNVTWFVCWYGRGRTIAWWEELKHDPKKVSGCTMKIRNKVDRDPMDIRFICQ